MTKEEVHDALKEMGVHHLYSYRLETRALPQVLGMDERIYGITSGLYQGKRWLVPVTGQHLYLISVHLVSKTEVKRIERGSISSATAKKGMLFSKITLKMEDEDDIMLEHVAKASVDRFLWAIQR